MGPLSNAAHETDDSAASQPEDSPSAAPTDSGASRADQPLMLPLTEGVITYDRQNSREYPPTPTPVHATEYISHTGLYGAHSYADRFANVDMNAYSDECPHTRERLAKPQSSEEGHTNQRNQINNSDCREPRQDRKEEEAPLQMWSGSHDHRLPFPASDHRGSISSVSSIPNHHLRQDAAWAHYPDQTYPPHHENGDPRYESDAAGFSGPVLREGSSAEDDGYYANRPWYSEVPCHPQQYNNISGQGMNQGYGPTATNRVGPYVPRHYNYPNQHPNNNAGWSSAPPPPPLAPPPPAPKGRLAHVKPRNMAHPSPPPPPAPAKNVGTQPAQRLRSLGPPQVYTPFSGPFVESEPSVHDAHQLEGDVDTHNEEPLSVTDEETFDAGAFPIKGIIPNPSGGNVLLQHHYKGPPSQLSAASGVSAKTRFEHSSEGPGNKQISGITNVSPGHPDACKPCAFFHENKCKNGDSCNYCHASHPPKKKKSMKEQKNLMIITRYDGRSEGRMEYIRCNPAAAKSVSFPPHRVFRHLQPTL